MVNAYLMSIIFSFFSPCNLLEMGHNYLNYIFQVCMDLVGSVPASYDKCLITRTPMWHFVWICVWVSLVFDTSLSIPFYFPSPFCSAILHKVLSWDSDFRYKWLIQLLDAWNILLFCHWGLFLACKYLYETGFFVTETLKVLYAFFLESSISEVEQLSKDMELGGRVLHHLYFLLSRGNYALSMQFVLAHY